MDSVVSILEALGQELRGKYIYVLAGHGNNLDVHQQMNG